MHRTETVAANVETTPAPPRRVLVALSLTQIPSWGVLYYAFPVALADIAADTGWSTTKPLPRSPPDWSAAASD